MLDEWRGGTKVPDVMIGAQCRVTVVWSGYEPLHYRANTAAARAFAEAETAVPGDPQVFLDSEVDATLPLLPCEHLWMPEKETV